MLSDVLERESAYLSVFFITAARGAMTAPEKRSVEDDVAALGSRVVWVEFDVNKGNVPRIEKHTLLRPAPQLDDESAA